jgi:hypothetical protein
MCRNRAGRTADQGAYPYAWPRFFGVEGRRGNPARGMEGGYGMVGAGVISRQVASRSGGATDTAQPRGGYTEEQLVDLVKGFPIPRMGHADEIASTAAFLAGPASS